MNKYLLLLSVIFLSIFVSANTDSYGKQTDGLPKSYWTNVQGTGDFIYDFGNDAEIYRLTQQMSPKSSEFQCGTMEYLEIQKKVNPNLAIQMQEFEKQVKLWISEKYKEKSGDAQLQSLITVPVVVHILYSDERENVSDEKVDEQIEILNRDFGGQNPHPMGSFQDYLKANTGIQFVLAKRTIDGRETTGIERRQTTAASFPPNNGMKYYYTGGLDAWDPTIYFNIWVVDLDNYSGYAQFPGTAINSSFGVVVDYRGFGLTEGFYMTDGGLTTHEIGHCFNLRHIWGDDAGACTGTDYAEDVPNQSHPTYRNWQGPVTDDCSQNNPGIMYMNFMDYTADASMANFTPDQTLRIQACFAEGAPLYSLANSSSGDLPTGCEKPTGVRASFLSTTRATIEWTAMYGATSYNINYRKSGTTTWLSSISNQNFTEISGLVKNTSYEVRVQSMTGACNSNFSDLIEFKTLKNGPPPLTEAPSLSAPANAAASVELNPTLSWNPLTNNYTYYELQISEDVEFSNPIKLRGTSLYRYLFGLSYGRVYYWKVRGCNVSYPGPWSETRFFTTLNPTLSKPMQIFPEDNYYPVSISPKIAWEAVPNADSYVVQYSNYYDYSIYNQTQTNELSVDLSSLSQGKLYYWRVKAINNSGEFSPWAERNFTTEVIIPDGSVPLIPQNESVEISVNPYISWSSVDNANYYRLQYSEDPTFATISGGVTTSETSTNLQGLKSNTTYHWRVIVWFNETYLGVPSPWSASYSFTTGAVTLGTPTLIAPTNNSIEISINPALTWNPVVNADNYILQFANNSDFTGYTEIPTTTASANLSNLSYLTQYYWRVKAVNNGTESQWSDVWNFTTADDILLPPTLVSPINNAVNIATSPTLTWNAVDGAESYNLQYSKSSDFSQNTQISNISGTSSQISGLSLKTYYYWRVNASNQDNTSVWSNIWKFKTVLKGKLTFPEANEAVVASASLKFNPNPISNFAYFDLAVYETDMIRIEITDIAGREIAVLKNETLNQGNYSFSFDASNLATGVYYCHLIVGDEIQTIKMLVVK